jgi:predicted RNA-binding protein with PUA-like domain
MAAAKKNATKTKKKATTPNPLAALVATGAYSCWSIKSEPFVYSFDQLIADKQTSWDGVRNFEARNMMRAMKKGDTLLYYHSNEGKEIVGIARVSKEAYKDPTSDEDEDWSSVGVVPVKKLVKPVGLAMMKAHPVLKKMPLVARSRISVTPVSDEELAMVLKLSNTSL